MLNIGSFLERRSTWAAVLVEGDGGRVHIGVCGIREVLQQQ